MIKTDMLMPSKEPTVLILDFDVYHHLFDGLQLLGIKLNSDKFKMEHAYESKICQKCFDFDEKAKSEYKRFAHKLTNIGAKLPDVVTEYNIRKVTCYFTEDSIIEFMKQYYGPTRNTELDTQWEEFKEDTRQQLLSERKPS